MQRHAFVAALGAATLLAAPLHAEQATEIQDHMTLGSGPCTIEVEGPAALCAGEVATYTATVTCDDGYTQTSSPEWYLDGDLVGTGDSIDLLLDTLGAHQLLVSCGSCEITLPLDVAACEWVPEIDVSYADDDIAATSGVFLERNGTGAGAAFPEHAFRMRPVTVDLDPAAPGGVTLDVTGEPVVELYDPATGTEVALPASYTRAELPVTVLLSGTDYGDAELIASYDENLGGDVAARGPAASIPLAVAPWPGLSCKRLASHPYAHWVDAFFTGGDTLFTALDPSRHPSRANQTADVYVVAHKTASDWAANPTLVDVTGSVVTTTVDPNSLAANIVARWDDPAVTGSLVEPSTAYDIVYDFGQDGQLDPGDLIDGLATAPAAQVHNNLAGAYALFDITQPSTMPVAVVNHSPPDTTLRQRVFFPALTAAVPPAPLVMISHGASHDYTWYDYLGRHLASWGYVVVSHWNDTNAIGGAVENASLTTIRNTDHFLASMAAIDPALPALVDPTRIMWIGHSVGGEGVLRAFTRIAAEAFPTTHFTPADIVFIGSMAPTAFTQVFEAQPFEKPYLLLAAAGDTDTEGNPFEYYTMYNRLTERGFNTTAEVYIHGAHHEDFDTDGPDLCNVCPPGHDLDRSVVQSIVRGAVLAHAELWGRDNPATREYMTRAFHEFRAPSLGDTVTVARWYRELNGTTNVPPYRLDTFQVNYDVFVNDAGGLVTFDFPPPALGNELEGLFEGIFDDTDAEYDWDPQVHDPFNGMTFAYTDSLWPGEDLGRGIAFGFPAGETRYIAFEIPPADRDVREHRFVSFRACQTTRHPYTLNHDDWLSFTVTLVDIHGVSSQVAFEEWASLTPLFPRAGFGFNAVGWTNEMNTVRIPLAAFETDGSGIDLSQVELVRLDFGFPFGSPEGHLVFDDLFFMPW